MVVNAWRSRRGVLDPGGALACLPFGGGGGRALLLVVVAHLEGALQPGVVGQADHVAAADLPWRHDLAAGRAEAELINQCCQSTTAEGAHPEHPHVLPGAADDGRPEGSRRVDGAAVQGNGHQVANEHSEADRKGCQHRDVGSDEAAVGIGGGQHHEHQREGEQALQQPPRCAGQARRQRIHTAARRVPPRPVHRIDEGAAKNGTADLGNPVQERPDQRDLLSHQQSERHRRVEVAPTECGRAVHQDCDGEAEGHGDGQYTRLRQSTGERVTQGSRCGVGAKLPNVD
mmetsp:Transcript_8463/g.25361  ORF Transcript_8463/g.25361 Transcript_8463/m.25361 type:complete len:287 (-) Transcript_8463:311-1171(-)